MSLNRVELAIAAVALVVGGLAGFPVQRVVYDYQWSDPQFCDDCHVHDYANQAYDRSVHAGLTTCHDCHRVPIRHYPWNLYRAVFDRPEGPDDIAQPHVESVICSQCHSVEGADEVLTGPMPESVRERVVKIDTSPLHRVHLDAAVRTPGAYAGGDGAPKPGTIGCVDCHGTGTGAAHRFESGPDHCEQCHSHTVPTGELGKVGCRDCHGAGFLVP